MGIPRDPFSRRLGESWNKSGHFGDEMNLLHMPRIHPWLLSPQPVTSSLHKRHNIVVRNSSEKLSDYAVDFPFTFRIQLSQILNFCCIKDSDWFRCLFELQFAFRPALYVGISQFLSSSYLFVGTIFVLRKELACESIPKCFPTNAEQLMKNDHANPNSSFPSGFALCALLVSIFKRWLPILSV
jgi:hypothetical protein